MRKSASLLMMAALVLAASGATAQEPEPVEPAEETRAEPVRKIRVLEDPYDLASFYRSRQTRTMPGFLGEGPAAPLGNAYDNPYAIAGYYRSRQGSGAYGYSQFWVSGYGDRRGRGFGRRIGAHGDVFLIVPTILAPIGPLTGSLLVER